MDEGNDTELFILKNLTDLYEDGEDLPVFPAVVQIVQTILFTVVCVVGLVGNTLVIYVVVRFSKMQTVTNLYIVNLAIADEFFLIGAPFLIATLLKRHWIFGFWACKAYMISTSINQFTSSILLCIMSADRYIAVCHPISSPRWRTPFISKIVAFLAWCCSIILMIPIIEHAKEVPKYEDNSTKSCVLIWYDDLNYVNSSMDVENSSNEGPIDATIFTLYTFIFSFALPLSLILFFYCEVIKKLKTVGPKNKSKEKKRSHRKVTNLVLTVITVYVICWLPYWITQLAIISNPTMDSTFYITIHLLVSCLSYSNSAVNPILYAFLSENFKKSFMKACICAAKKDVNATLNLENSVFPKKTKHTTDKGGRATRNTSICPNIEAGDGGPLVEKGDASTSAMTLTSRTNITTSSGDNSRGSVSPRNAVRNGTVATNNLMSEPTSL